MAGFARVVGLVFLASVLLSRAGVADSLAIYAAGSLNGAFSEMIAAFPAAPDTVATPVFGPSGLLRERIEQGAPGDILASADMAQPRKLAHPGQPVILFTRNRMCALGRAGLTPDNMLDRMLDPAVRLATSTPGADPSGDYAWAVFEKADALHPGAKAVLEAKALTLFGGSLNGGSGAIQGIFVNNRADILLSYCSGFGSVIKDVPGLVSVPMPAALSVGPAYGMVVLSDRLVAARFALFVMSEQGQAILQRFGFDPVGLQ